MEAPVEGTARLFSEEARGLLVQLPGWRYPVVCQIENGQLLYDNFSGRWGCQENLDRFLQLYAVEKAKIEARKQGQSVFEQPLANGAIKLTLQPGG